MKKSVAILIGIIYIASIFIINLFGLKMSVYNEKHSVAKIECVALVFLLISFYDKAFSYFSMKFDRRKDNA